MKSVSASVRKRPRIDVSLNLKTVSRIGTFEPKSHNKITEETKADPNPLPQADPVAGVPDF